MKRTDPSTCRLRYVECDKADRAERYDPNFRMAHAIAVKPSTLKEHCWDKAKKALRPLCLNVLAFVILGLCSTHQILAETASSNSNSLASPDDPVKRVRTDHRADKKESLIESNGLKNFYQKLDAGRANLHKSTGLKIGAFHSTLFQLASNSLPGQDDYGIATITGIYGTWDVITRGEPNAGQISFGIEGRWGYGDNLTPSELGTIGIGSATGTTDPYGSTTPAVVLRELFWRQGAPEIGWNYRIGKITPDRLLTSSEHADPVSMFLPVGSQGSPSVAFPDSGLGLAAGWFPSDRIRVGALVADANGDRTDFGDIGEGNFFKAIEFQAQLLPLTNNAGYSSAMIWHTDGVDDPSNALDSSTGESGWGYFLKLEQELSRDGQNIGMIRYGHSFDDAAVYKQQASIRYIRLDPPDPFRLKDDRFGIAASWVDPLVNPADRDEWGIDTFYRFNLLERIETSFAYQVIFDPTFNPDKDSVHVFSFRFTQFF